MQAAERATIDAALRAHDGNLLRTARALGIERNTLKRKRKAYGLETNRDPGGRDQGERDLVVHRRRQRDER